MFLHCDKCNHDWISRLGKIPVMCPNCTTKSKYGYIKEVTSKPTRDEETESND